MSARLLPALDEPGAFFWTAGARGELRVAWCASCAQHLHPSCELCPRCLGADLADVAVSGAATVVAFTDNHQPWLAGMPPPYVIAIVELCDAPSVRLTSNLIDCDAQDLRIGLAVQVRFVAHGEVWLPLFTPRADASPTTVRVPVYVRTRGGFIRMGSTDGLGNMGLVGAHVGDTVWSNYTMDGPWDQNTDSSGYGATWQMARIGPTCHVE